MNSAAATIVDSRAHDLGGLVVRRVLPHLDARSVGPFVFFDHMGPARFAPGQGVDVRPHPHIGLATVTYLFDGVLLHRDSLGVVQEVSPGDVNWMTAGRGIVHSERTPPVQRAAGHLLHGMQTWIALPTTAEEVDPSFHHHPVATLPIIERPGVRLRLIAGNAYGLRAPVRTFSEMFYLGAEFRADATLSLPPEHEARGIYAVDAELLVDGQALAPGRLAVLLPGRQVEIHAKSDARAMLFGGAPVGERYLYWNFVSSSRERIERAKDDWAAQRFAPVPGESEYIPLPPR